MNVVVSVSSKRKRNIIVDWLSDCYIVVLQHSRKERRVMNEPRHSSKMLMCEVHDNSKRHLEPMQRRASMVYRNGICKK